MATLADLRGFDAGQFIQFGQAGQKQRTLADIGQAASTGDFRGAQSAAFAGGENDIGMKLKQMNDQDKMQLVEQAASWAYDANDPQKWEAGRAQWQAKGFDPGPFQGRNVLLSQAQTVQQKMAQANQQAQMAQTQSNADRNYALDERRLAQGGAGGGLGNTVIPMADDAGNPAVGRLSPNGIVIAEPPKGYRALGPGGVAAARVGAGADAKTAATARSQLPGAEQAVKIAKQAVDLLRQDTAGQKDQFGSFLGVIPQQMLPAIPGTDKAKFRVNLEQAGGQAFMQARNMLKGGGQITDYEGRRGEAAYSRMQAAAESGDRQQFLQALDDFEQAVDAGYKKLQETAQGGYAAGAQKSGPVTINGYTIEQAD